MLDLVAAVFFGAIERGIRFFDQFDFSFSVIRKSCKTDAESNRERFSFPLEVGALYGFSPTLRRFASISRIDAGKQRGKFFTAITREDIDLACARFQQTSETSQHKVAR